LLVNANNTFSEFTLIEGFPFVAFFKSIKIEGISGDDIILVYTTDLKNCKNQID
jgi:hypothetical protein